MRRTLAAACFALAATTASAFEIRLMVGQMCHPGLGDHLEPDILITDEEVTFWEGNGCRVSGGWREVEPGVFVADLHQCIVRHRFEVPDTQAFYISNPDGSADLITGVTRITAWPCRTE